MSDGAQGLAFELGNGRVVVLGETGMLRAARDEDGRAAGMNLEGAGNRLLAIRILDWLGRAGGR